MKSEAIIHHQLDTTDLNNYCKFCIGQFLPSSSAILTPLRGSFRHLTLTAGNQMMQGFLGGKSSSPVLHKQSTEANTARVELEVSPVPIISLS